MEENVNTAPSGSNKNMMPVVIGVILLIVLGGFAFFATQNAQQPAPSTTPESITAEETPTTASGSVSGDTDTADSEETEGEVKEFKVTGSSYAYNPEEITVNEGDTVRIVFTTEDGMHDWVVDEFDARTEVLQAGESETIEFVADKAGTYEYYCSVGSHRQMGMVGKLIVE